MIELVALALALLVIAIVFVPTLMTGSSPVPTSFKVRATILRVLPERLPGPDSGVIYELGSGWGGMAFALALKYPDRPVIGYEISLLPWLVARIRLLFSRPANLRFELANFNTRTLSDAALVLCYLLPEPMHKLKGKLEAELAPGTLVLSNTFAFRDWFALNDKVADDVYKSHVFLYEIGTTEGSKLTSQ